MCNHENREAAMVVIREGVWCDPCLVPLVTALNDAGMTTVASCCGHGTNTTKVSLADGRELVVLDRDQFDRVHDLLFAPEPAESGEAFWKAKYDAFAARYAERGERESRIARGYDCPGCDGTGRGPLVNDMPDGSARVSPCACGGTGRAKDRPAEGGQVSERLTGDEKREIECLSRHYGWGIHSCSTYENPPLYAYIERVLADRLATQRGEVS